ncbi:MAG: MerR family transcriptional regulator [Clostridia bacterium]|nr:MerR family transcriptional regulator [Clostridia bacterium]
MKELYAIGEVAKIMGVSVQTLRHYNKIELIKPEYINPETHYRYYSVKQLHFIDRIKYLQKFGFNLSEIKRVLDQNNIPLLLSLLEKQEEVFRREISRTKDIIDGIRWYKDYFTYVDTESFENSNCYTLSIEPRYLLVVPCLAGEPKEDFHIRLNELKNSKKFKDLSYQRQFAYILDYESLLDGKLAPIYLGMFIKEKPVEFSESILEVPGGEFLCFKARILSEGWNPYFIKLFFEDRPKPSIVIANEYENSLYEYSRCVYEVQTLISHNLG